MPHTPDDLSEQFFFWATKKKGGDPNPHGDGTRLQYAVTAIQNEGVCTRSHWPYDESSNPSNVTHEIAGHTPSPTAEADAKTRVRQGVSYGFGIGHALDIYRILHQQRRPVAVALPVMRDAAFPGNPDNWNTAIAVQFGEIFNPPPTAVVIGGHAVCVTGFMPDASEPLGGYFVFRNSWSNGWAYRAPLRAHPVVASPEPGYGCVSATYVNDFLWEFCSL